MKRPVVYSILAGVFATGLAVAGVAAPSSAQVAPPASTECTVAASMHTSGSNVVMDAHVYSCSTYKALVYIDIIYTRGTTTLKEEKTHCSPNLAGGLAACEKSWNYSFANPSGKQDWQVEVYATYVNSFDGRDSVTDDAGGSY